MDIVTLAVVGKLVKDGKTDSEIAEKLNLTERKIGILRHFLGLKSNRLPNKIYKELERRAREEIPINQLAREIGVSDSVVKRYRKKIGVKIVYERRCLYCKRRFETEYNFQRLCCQKCGQYYHVNKNRKIKIESLRQFIKRNYPIIFSEYHSIIGKTTHSERPIIQKKCLHCGKVFSMRNKWKKYCSEKCKKMLDTLDIMKGEERKTN